MCQFKNYVYSIAVCFLLSACSEARRGTQLADEASTMPAANALLSSKIPTTFQSVSHNALFNMVKFSGCTVDGLLGTSSGVEVDGNNDLSAPRLTLFPQYVAMLERSNCIFINRALEIWDTPPDFAAISANVAEFNRITNRPYVIGANLAESVSLNPNIHFFYPDENREFIFANMCAVAPQPNETSCLASFSQTEYRKYILYILKRSMDLGFQVFEFGAVGNTDGGATAQNSNLLQIIQAAKNYAASKGIATLYIAQLPQPWGGPDYLAGFDFIQAPIYMDPDGNIPAEATTRNKIEYPVPDRLFYNSLYNRNQIIAEYDWFARPQDDSSELARMSFNSPTYLNNVRDYVNAAFPVIVTSYPELTNFSFLWPENKLLDVVRQHYNFFRDIGSGMWLPYRHAVAFPPWAYTPLNLPLYQGTPYEINYNDEIISSVQPIRPETKITQHLFMMKTSATLIQQADGNLCLYGAINWCNGSNGKPVAETKFTANGNLVQTDAEGNLIWQSGTTGRGMTLELLENQLVIRDTNRSVIWTMYSPSPSPAQGPHQMAPSDFNGDNISDGTTFRNDGTWSIGGVGVFGWGLNGDVPMSGDYDGDHRSDLVVYRPSDSHWYIRKSSSNFSFSDYQNIPFGSAGDIPVSGDFDGDRKTDLAYFRPSNGHWYVLRSSDGIERAYGWGLPGDVPVPGDYDGDGISDVAVFRPSNAHWYLLKSSDSFSTSTYQDISWGDVGDVPVPGDYDGDGKTDFAVFRPSNAHWYILKPYGTFQDIGWGIAGDIPLKLDFDGDGKIDIGVFRPSLQFWHIINSSNGRQNALGPFGGANDIPVPKVF